MQKFNPTQIQSLGLPAMQAKVYLAALELGRATIQALARKSGVNRSTIYNFIEDMKARGYLHETSSGKRRIYSAADPEKLVEMEKARLQNLESILPDLLAINNNARRKPRVTYYEGMAGIREVYMDIFREKQPIMSYEDLDHLAAGLSPEIYKWAPKARADHGIMLRAISADTTSGHKFSKNDKALLRETKFIKSKGFKNEIKIYGNKIAFVDLRGDPSFCVIIENPLLAETMREIWSLLWDRIDGA